MDHYVADTRLHQIEYVILSIPLAALWSENLNCNNLVLAPLWTALLGSACSACFGTQENHKDSHTQSGPQSAHRKHRKNTDRCNAHKGKHMTAAAKPLLLVCVVCACVSFYHEVENHHSVCVMKNCAGLFLCITCLRFSASVCLCVSVKATVSSLCSHNRCLYLFYKLKYFFSSLVKLASKLSDVPECNTLRFTLHQTCVYHTCLRQWSVSFYSSSVTGWWHQAFGKAGDGNWEQGTCGCLSFDL